jgi:hypothetical protein
MPWYMIEVEIWSAQINNWLNPPCPRCRALHGQEFDRGLGPTVPLHEKCRCTRRFNRIRYTPKEPGSGEQGFG